MSETTPEDAARACAEMLRRQDHDRYLTCLFAPAETRPALVALYAFNLEVAKTAEVVSEPMLGQIRLQWWRETVAGIYDGRPRVHQVVSVLAEAVQRHGLTRAHFERLIDAREADLAPAGPASLEALEDYARGTSAGLLWLALEVLGPESRRSEAAKRAAEAVGIAWALTGLLRAVPFHARRKRLMLPAELARDCGLSSGELFELHPSPPLKALCRRVAERAAAHLERAREQSRAVPRQARPALRLAALARGHLAVLRAAGYDPFDPRVQRRPAAGAWRLAWAGLRGQY